MLFLADMFTHASQLYSYIFDQSWYMSVSCISTKITGSDASFVSITLNMVAPQAPQRPWSFGKTCVAMKFVDDDDEARTHFLQLFLDHFHIPRLFQVFHVGGHHETSSLLTASAETALTLSSCGELAHSSVIKGTSDQHHWQHSGPKRAGTHSSLSLPSAPCSNHQPS